ncbi:unnamed protein product [Trifolium pratense]|uniref:Uncharacterized protein n=1 Tax=Trifolium pratense TaxID=57577 RepID=A0ACB0K128_TRIPR|nr:unnamed protein product [Trifolium pratense]
MYINRLDLKVDDHKNSAIFNVFDEAAQDCFLRYHVQMVRYRVVMFHMSVFSLLLVTYFQSSSTDMQLRIPYLRQYFTRAIYS